MSMTNQWWRIGGYCGIFFVVLFIVGVVVQGESPNYGDSAQTIRTYFENDGKSYLLGDWLDTIAFVFGLLPLMVTMRLVFGRAERSPQFLTHLAFAAGIIFFAVAAASSAGNGAMALAAKDVSDDVLLGLNAVNAYGFEGFGVMLALFVLASSACIYVTGVIWRWLAILGLIVGLAGVIGTAGILDRDPMNGVLGIFGIIGFLGSALFLLLVSVAFAMMKDEPVVVPDSLSRSDTGGGQ